MKSVKYDVRLTMPNQRDADIFLDVMKEGANWFPAGKKGHYRVQGVKSGKVAEVRLDAVLQDNDGILEWIVNNA